MLRRSRLLGIWATRLRPSAAALTVPWIWSNFSERRVCCRLVAVGGNNGYELGGWYGIGILRQSRGADSCPEAGRGQYAQGGSYCCAEYYERWNPAGFWQRAFCICCHRDLWAGGRPYSIQTGQGTIRWPL